MEFVKTLKTRRSCRKYLDKQISDTDLEKIILAGNTAPVGMGRYGKIQITVIQNATMLKRISTECAEIWNGKTFDPIWGAPTLIIVSEAPEKEEAHIANVACIVENMHLMATDLGLGSVYLWGFVQHLKNNKQLLLDLGIDSAFAPLSALALGYPAKPLTERDYTRLKIKTNYIK